MRTDEEILARIKEVAPSDVLGFETPYLISRLSFEAAKEFILEGTTKERWDEVRGNAPRDRESLLAEMLEYMPFAWEKANNERGISAGRSLHHYSAWVWLAGDDLGDLNDHQFYGKDNLVAICEHYGWDHKQWDDGRQRRRAVSFTPDQEARIWKLIEGAEKRPPVPWTEFALSGVDWAEWPGGAAEILSSQMYFRDRAEDLEKQLKQKETALADVREEREQFATMLRELRAKGLG